MPRQGMQKVKTGCITCKIRKVKCDEARPSCHRCVNTGRKCDGYIPAVAGTYSWTQLLDKNRPAPSVDNSEKRAIDFFLLEIAPVLSRSNDSYFWTDMVVQLCYQNGAVKHAVLAIGSLYRTFSSGQYGSLEHKKQDLLATGHYTEAIRQSRRVNDRETSLVLCLLFVCIEFLRGESEAAIEHCRHGINILNEPLTGSHSINERISAAFSRLCIFPFFFGATPNTFPYLNIPSPEVLGPFQTVNDASSALDVLLTRAIRFVRSADAHRLGVQPSSEPDISTLQARQEIESVLDHWFAAYHLLKTEKRQVSPPDYTGQLVEIRWLICKIWIGTCLAREETVYDGHMDRFRTILDLSLEAAAIFAALPSERLQQKFSWEWGFSPLLAFVVIKCRCLRVRTAAWHLMQTLALPRESLWDKVALASLGRRTIEIEHDLAEDIDLDQVVDHGIFPSEDKRIRDSFMYNETALRPLAGGQYAEHRKTCFLMQNPMGDGHLVRDEWLVV
ncbi:hypothetical protein JX266_001138 [Neoarthrinium moseri]|nr:hypothetical protein JX266_001138 [Neoarthrinium moseri]